jgi:hypothetical protein
MKRHSWALLLCLLSAGCTKEPRPGEKTATPAPAKQDASGMSAEQKQAIEDVNKIKGVSIGVDSKKPGMPAVSAMMIGDEITDAALEKLKAFPQLKSLSLANTKVTDAGLKHLEGLSQLKELTIHFTPKVTEAGVRDLQKALPDLKIKR